VSKSPLDGSLVAREAVDVGGPGPPGAKAVQADPGDDRRQPAGEVLDGVGVGAGELEPRLLHGVVRLGPAAEHPVGDARRRGRLASNCSASQSSSIVIDPSPP
jgi:hypothetical protein